MPEAPSLLRTGFTVIWAFIVASVAWLRVSSFYSDGTVAATNVFLPDGLWLEWLGGTITINAVVEGATYRQGVHALALHSGLLIVVALVAGTPWRSLTWRALAAGYVAACFFLIQVIGMAVYVLLLRRSVDGGVLANDVEIGFAIFWALTPMGIGGWWAYRFWLPAFRIRTVAPLAPVDAERIEAEQEPADKLLFSVEKDI
ncbi:MAG: hypothetical protein O2884_11375 [Chloroflexi bacterium]|nr:hypothetical protein [Chloroflexota bacterium]